MGFRKRLEADRGCLWRQFSLRAAHSRGIAGSLANPNPPWKGYFRKKISKFLQLCPTVILTRGLEK